MLERMMERIRAGEEGGKGQGDQEKRIIKDGL